MSKIKPVNLDSDTFDMLKKDMTTELNRLIRTMQNVGADAASMTVKLSVEFKDEKDGDGDTVTVPTFEHTVTSSVAVKNKTEGKLGGYYSLIEDNKGGYLLKPMIDQVDMFEETDE